MTKLFIDSDVCLDVLVPRTPFATDAAKLFSLIHEGRAMGIVSALGLVNVYYFLRKDLGKEQAKMSLSKFKTLVVVQEVTDQIISQALLTDFSDFEDAVQYLTAKKAKAEVILTRNTKDFKKSTLPVYTPEQFLKNFN